MSTKGLPVLLGAGVLGSSKGSDATIDTVTLAEEFTTVFRRYGGTVIDTARDYPPGAYGTSEEYLGQTDVASWAMLDTKVDSAPGKHSAEQIASSIQESLAALKVDKVNLVYLHRRDRSTPLSTTVAAMAAAQSKGHMNNWGISNYSIEEVKEIIALCRQNGYPLPIVYQGHYSPIARKMEAELLPLLREHRIAFYAYSPGAGGAFSQKSSRKQSNVRSLPFVDDHRLQHVKLC